MPSKERAELIEEVKELILDGNLYAWTLQETSQRILSTILAALQEPSDRMKIEGAMTHMAGTQACGVIWKEMLAASVLGEQAE
ncbi:hypothetical protein [Ochrobactrum sp. RH2CCR150]|uniref:hypothetical protein n=1 Tax=Ochrobactrum sp. RH2CCR150 TaxID=2587044 RepID=UPI0015FD08A6|nr:hypothetical protein [Ochrobactrum sp. RH2CCR150]